MSTTICRYMPILTPTHQIKEIIKYPATCSAKTSYSKPNWPKASARWSRIPRFITLCDKERPDMPNASECFQYKKHQKKGLEEKKEITQRLCLNTDTRKQDTTGGSRTQVEKQLDISQICSSNNAKYTVLGRKTHLIKICRNFRTEIPGICIYACENTCIKAYIYTKNVKIDIIRT